MFPEQLLVYVLTLTLVVRFTLNDEYSWADFHSREYYKIETDDLEVDTAVYRLSNMYCDPRKMHDSTCPEIKKMDWIIGIDASWYDNDLESGRKVYLKMKGMLTILTEKLKKVANFSHEAYTMGIYLAWAGGVKTVKFCCLLYEGSWEPYVAILYNMPNERALIMNAGERASGMVKMFDAIDYDMVATCDTWWDRLSAARFIVIFHQYASPKLMWAYQPVFDHLNSWKTRYKERMVSVAFVSVTSSKSENIFTAKKPHEQQNFPHFGNMFVNTLTESADEDFLSDYIVNCACFRHDECIDDVKNVSACHFEVEVKGAGHSVELCVKNITQKVNARRMKVWGDEPISCYENPMIDCKLEECMHDCDLKSWFPWTECAPEAKTKYATQKRTRLFPTAGISKFTEKSCPEEEYRLCELSSTSIFVNTTNATLITEGTTTEIDMYTDEVTKDPDEAPITIPDDEKFSNFNRWLSQVAGLSVFLLICIVGLTLLALSLLIIACRQIAKRRREHSMSTRTGNPSLQRSKLSWSYISRKSKAASVKSLVPGAASQKSAAKSLGAAATMSRKSAAKSLGPAGVKSQKSATTSSKTTTNTSIFRRLTNFGRKSNTDGILASLASRRPPPKVR